MRIVTLVAVAALAGTAPALAQVPPANATIEGTQGPNANGPGYPSAAVQAGRIGTTAFGPTPTPIPPVAVPDAVPNPGNIAAGQPTMGTANGVDQTPGTPK